MFSKRTQKILLIAFLKFIKKIDPENKKIRFPKKIAVIQKTVAEIFFIVVKYPDTELFYDVKTNECYLKNEKRNIYLFIEDGNIKVIDSIYSYDIPINNDLEIYLTNRFLNELTKRRTIFKDLVMSKTEYSLLNTLTNLRS